MPTVAPPRPPPVLAPPPPPPSLREAVTTSPSVGEQPRSRSATAPTMPAAAAATHTARNSARLTAGGGASRSMRSLARSETVAIGSAWNLASDGGNAQWDARPHGHAPAGSGGGLPSTGPRAAGVFSRAVPSADGAAGAPRGGGGRGHHRAPAH